MSAHESTPDLLRRVEAKHARRKADQAYAEVLAERDALLEEVRQLRAILPALVDFLARVKRVSILPVSARAEFLRRWTQSLIDADPERTE